MTAVHPLHPAIAAGIQAADRQTTVKLYGEIPVVNIATPNTAGVSHNRYRDFNISPKGAVLNNGQVDVNSELIGHLAANPHLTGDSAQLIINEVTSRQPSSLEGMLAIFGQKANVIIANPNGLIANNSWFSKIDTITLTTGTPILNRQGALEQLNVVGGAITIGDKGFNTLNQNDTAIISRTLNLDGKIHANQLDIILGANQVDYQNGAIRPLAAAGAAPCTGDRYPRSWWNVC